MEEEWIEGVGFVVAPQHASTYLLTLAGWLRSQCLVLRCYQPNLHTTHRADKTNPFHCITASKAPSPIWASSTTNIWGTRKAGVSSRAQSEHGIRCKQRIGKREGEDARKLKNTVIMIVLRRMTESLDGFGTVSQQNRQQKHRLDRYLLFLQKTTSRHKASLNVD